MQNLKPNRGYVAVDPIFEADTYTTKTGLELIKPDQYKGRCTQGVVKYVGEAVTKVKRGDYVFFSAYSGTLWNYKDELLIIIAEKGISCKLDLGEDTREIPGLYFKEAGINPELVDWIDRALREHTILNTVETRDRILRGMLHNSSYFPATYSHVIKFIASAFDAIPVKELNINNPENFLDLTHANIEDK